MYVKLPCCLGRSGVTPWDWVEILSAAGEEIFFSVPNCLTAWDAPGSPPGTGLKYIEILCAAGKEKFFSVPDCLTAWDVPALWGTDMHAST